MPLVEINRNPAPGELRQFAWLWLAFITVAGGAAWFKLGSLPAMGLWVLAITVPVLGHFHSPILRVAYLTVSYAAFPVGFVVSHLVLAAVFFLVLTPIGLILRMAGHDPLGLRDGLAAESYWRERPAASDTGLWLRQF